ncbi:hypothetical protein [Thermofilum pendens]|uniref:Uncharacterized protein n=1 Tax=Thermofilum pendens (strain DSM 2475 / Hrk 5) TaxID=368408 RepID=A1RXE4_THEPD|nr:hypothetical protein [Thermofilum pendens]ABL77874.1 hypothetical protein Tpen_0465 [Thermofilum pendens Hrk 5]
MLRTRILRSVGVYVVEKDREVFWLDLRVSGFRQSKRVESFLPYFNFLRKWLVENGLIRDLDEGENHVLRFSKDPESPEVTVLVILLKRGNRVSKAIISPLKPGLLRLIDERLRGAGWRSVFLVDMKTRTRVREREAV